MRRLFALVALALVSGLPLMTGCSTPRAATEATDGISDRDIADDVIYRLREDPVTSRYPFSIASDQGVVSIAGSIGSEDARMRAVSIVRGAPGVKGVIDNMTR